MALLTPVHTSDALTFDVLRDRLVEGWRRAAGSGRPGLVSIGERVPALDPLIAFAHAEGRQRSYWEHQEPNRTTSLALTGIGAAHTIVAGGEARFAGTDQAWRELLDGALIDTPEAETDGRWGSGPILMGGFSFDPLQPRTAPWAGFPDGMLVLPRLTLAASDAGCLLTLNCVLSPASNVESEATALLRLRDWLLDLPSILEERTDTEQPLPALEDVLPAARWQAMVAETAREIRRGRYTKLVLARQARLPLPPRGGRAGARAVQALRRLRAGYPGSFLFAIAVPHGPTGDGGNQSGGESIFLGATPERLLRLQRGTVEATVLAGSARRGATADEDRRLGQELLASAKDRHEHAVVATMLREALAPLCRTLEVPPAPTLLPLPTVQHLYTPIHGQLEGTRSVLDLVARLHPTPAVGGYPRQEALAAIRAREALDRGWYGAPVGWLDHQGQGEFAVAIRSALLHPAPTSGREQATLQALLFAGCGIMGDSDPAREYAESMLKLQVMRAALAG